MTETTASVEHLRRAAHLAKDRHIKDASGFGGSTVTRGLAFCFGAAFFVVAVGMWAFTAPDTSVMLIKLGASIFFLGGAATCLLIAIAPHDFYRLEFDPRAGELRVLERDECGRFYVQRRERLADVGKINFSTGSLRVWGREGGLLLSVPMRRAQARETMRAVLSQI